MPRRQQGEAGRARRQRVGAAIRARREELGLTQEQAAKLARMTGPGGRTDWIKIEKGDAGVGLSRGRWIALALDMPLEDLGFTPDDVNHDWEQRWERLEQQMRETLAYVERIESALSPPNHDGASSRSEPARR